MFENPQNSSQAAGAAGGVSNPPTAQSSGTTIYTMPEKFMGGTSALRGSAGGPSGKPPTSGKRLILIVAIVAVLLGGLTFGAYYFLNSSSNPFVASTETDDTTTPGPSPADQQANTNGTVDGGNTNTTTDDQNQNENSSPTEGQLTPRERDEKRLADLISIADALDQYYVQSNAYPTFLSQLPSSIIAEVPRDPATGASYVYVAAGDRQSYEIVFEIEESVDFKGETWNRGTYRLKPIDFKEGSSAPVEPLPTTSLGSIDADSDGLTAAEEKVMQTSPQTGDTDADGYPDATEIANFYSPIQSGAVKLNEAGLVRQFESATLKLSFFYPTSWRVDVLEDAQEVLITTQTGEYISIQVKDNPDEKTSWEWYVENVSGDLNQNSVNIVTIAGHEAVRTLDGLSAYVAVVTRVMVVQYNRGDAKTVDYPSLFTFILNYLAVN